MKLAIQIFILLISSFPNLVIAQTETYTVTKAPFSRSSYDEFSPVFYNNGLVFSANRTSGLASYSTSNDERFFNMYYVDLSENDNKVSLFSKDLRSKLNDGPVTFNSTRDSIYFSRNLLVDGNLSAMSSNRNKLGIFHAVLEEGKWSRIREFRFNNEWYNVTTPCLSPDGQRLYFASDKPDGYGGSDIYFSEWKDGYWDNPVNLGPLINTSGNEAYPFVNPAGELFFSSDGHPGLGGRDIFFSRLVDTTWLPPVRLDPPINSPFDDFGITTDTLMTEGYFSSNRDNSIDIFHFKTNLPQIFHADVQRENQYCYLFQDNGMIDIDTSDLQFKWNFGNENFATTDSVNHCFPGPGKYNIKLDVIDKKTGKLYFTKLSYRLQLQDVEQAYINAPDFIIKGDEMELDGLKSHLPGFEIINYAWDFGDGIRTFEEKLKHSYVNPGEYFVNLELTLRSELTGQIKKTGVSKKITVVNNTMEKEHLIAEQQSSKPELPDIRSSNNVMIWPEYSGERELLENAVFTIKLFSSKESLDLNSSSFSKLPDKYFIKEIFNPEDSTYSYIVDQFLNLMSAYPSFSEILNLGFNDVHVKTMVHHDPAEKELVNLMKVYNASADSYFDPGGRLTANAYIMLDQIVRFMNKYPLVKLEVIVHSDNTGTVAANLSLTQRRSQLLASYLINRGISNERIQSRGIGGVKPIASNLLDNDRKVNRRVEFRIIDDGPR